ncbi:hypothetical protein D3C73_768910 [compost metagenome]
MRQPAAEGAARSGRSSEGRSRAGRFRDGSSAGAPKSARSSVRGLKPKSSSSAAATGAAATAGAAWPWVRNSSSATRPAERAASTGAPVPWAAAMWSARTSEARSRVLTVTSSQSLRPERSASIRVSKTWAKRTRSSRPKAPAPPLTEWTARKTALIVSMSPSPVSSARRLVSRSPSNSAHSWKKVTLMASNGSSLMGAVLRPRRDGRRRSAWPGQKA